MNATSYYWSYIDFYALITYISYIYCTIMIHPLEQNSEAAAEFCKFHWKTVALLCLFHKVARLQACNVIKKRLLHNCFPVKFEKFLRTPILKNIGERLLLCINYFIIYLFYSSLQYTFFIFTNNFFFITQLIQ